MCPPAIIGQAALALAAITAAGALALAILAPRPHLLGQVSELRGGGHGLGGDAEQERDERKKMRFELDRLGGLLRAMARLVPEVARLLPADMRDDEFDAIDITGAFQRMREIHEEE